MVSADRDSRQLVRHVKLGDPGTLAGILLRNKNKAA